MDIQTKRVYDPVDMKDGVRVLVDRVWPRGLSKERVQADPVVERCGTGRGSS